MDARYLFRAIIDEAVQRGYGDIFDEDWNRDAQVEIKLTIAELRIAADEINWHPCRRELSRARKARMWRRYIEELDGVE